MMAEGVLLPVRSSAEFQDTDGSTGKLGRMRPDAMSLFMLL